MADPSTTAMLGQAAGHNRNFAELISVMRSSFSAMNVHQGQFTCGAAATTTVADTNVKATSFIALTPLNAAAGTLQAGATHLYVSARTAGASFAVTTASAGAAAGTENFQYLVINAG